jgi:ABC-type glycerol-3-phosphate transport system substrate-binding protein
LAFGQTITVLLGIDAAGKHMGERAQEFTTKTGIKVNLVEVEWDAMVNKQAVALKAKEPTYDIVDCGSFMLPEYVPGGLYADISDMYTPAERARFMDGMLDGVSIGGKLYAAPLMASWTIMFYNSEMFLKAGLDPNKPPKTWDELVAYGQKLQSPTVYAIADSLAPGEYISVAFFRWAKSAGAKISEFRGNKVFWLVDSPECVKALEFMQSMIKDGTMDPGSPTYYQQQIADLFGKGQAAMLVNWDMMQLAFKNPEQTTQQDLWRSWGSKRLAVRSKGTSTWPSPPPPEQGRPSSSSSTCRPRRSRRSAPWRTARPRCSRPCSRTRTSRK